MSQHLSIFVTNADNQAIRGAWVTVYIDGKETVHAQTNGKLDQPVSLTLPDALSTIKLRAVAGTESKEATVPSDANNYTFKFESIHGPTVTDPATPKAIWIPALVFTSTLLFFFIFVFFKVPTMTEAQEGIIAMLFPPFCGFAAFFMGGTALFALDVPKNKFGKIAFSATAGIAVFAFTWSYAPYWFKVKKNNAQVPLNTNAPVLVTNGRSEGSTAGRPSSGTIEPNSTKIEASSGSKAKPDEMVVVLRLKQPFNLSSNEWTLLRTFHGDFISRERPEKRYVDGAWISIKPSSGEIVQLDVYEGGTSRLFLGQDEYFASLELLSLDNIAKIKITKIDKL